MKFQQMFLHAAAGCLLVSASGAAMAQEPNTCPDGVISGGGSADVIRDVILDQQSCVIVNAVIEGDVVAQNSAFIVLAFVTVEGLVQITDNERATLLNTNVLGDTTTTPNEVSGNALAVVTGISNIKGDLSVNLNDSAVVEMNIVAGDLECVDNVVLDAQANLVGGEDNCTDGGEPPTGNLPPVADAGGPYVGLRDRPIQFDGSGSSDPDGSIQEYEWDFGDGGRGTGVAPEHVYTEVGDFTVTLTVTDNSGATNSDQTMAAITTTFIPGQ